MSCMPGQTLDQEDHCAPDEGQALHRACPRADRPLREGLGVQHWSEEAFKHLQKAKRQMGSAPASTDY